MKDAPNLSPAVLAKLKAGWQEEFERWKKRDLSARREPLWRALRINLRLCLYLGGRRLPPGVHGAGLANVYRERQALTWQCILVLIGATPEGKKELIGFQAGYRESAQSQK